MLGHELLQERYAVEPGHFDIEGHDIRLEGNDLVAGGIGVVGGTDHLDLGILFEAVREHPPGDSGVIDDQDADGTVQHGIW